MAACLWGGPGAVASHRSAAALWNLAGFPAGAVEITSPKNAGGLPPTFVVHRLQPEREGVTSEAGIPVTNPLFTLMELGRVAPVERVEIALDDALLRGQASLRGLGWVLEHFGVRGRRGPRGLRGLLKARGYGYEPAESRLEVKFRKRLAGSGLPKPCEQHEIRRNDRFVARVDFAYPDQRLVLETDAYMCHSARSDWQHDRWRDNTLVAMKWRVLRFTWDDVTRRPEWVLEQIHLALGSPEACRPRRGCPISTSAAGGRGATMEP